MSFSAKIYEKFLSILGFSRQIWIVFFKIKIIELHTSPFARVESSLYTISRIETLTETNIPFYPAISHSLQPPPPPRAVQHRF
jgi:hypothetical protein